MDFEDKLHESEKAGVWLQKPNHGTCFRFGQKAWMWDMSFFGPKFCDTKGPPFKGTKKSQGWSTLVSQKVSFFAEASHKVLLEISIGPLVCARLLFLEARRKLWQGLFIFLGRLDVSLASGPGSSDNHTHMKQIAASRNREIASIYF